MLQAILDSAVSAILAIDDAGRIRSVNPATEAMFGYRADEMLNQNIKMLMPEPYRTEHDDYISRHVKTGEKRIIGIGREVKGQRKNGSIFPIHLAVSEFLVDGQRFFSGIINDLSDRAELRDEVDRQSRLFETVFQHAPEALVISSPDGKILLFNPAATKIFGYDLAEATGMEWANLFGDADSLPQIEFNISRSIERAPDLNLSVMLRRKDGSTFPAEGNITQVVDQHAKPTVRVSVFRDVTERLKNKEAAVKSQRLEAIGQLTGGIAHDFNNLLTIISGNLELLEEQPLSEQDRDLLDRAARAADSGARLTKRLLTFAGRRHLAPAVINLNDQVRAMTELLRRTLGDMIELRTNLASPLWLVRADAGEVEAAVLNLAINARDAMPEGGTLAVRTDNIVLEEGETGLEDALRAGDYVRISVSDNGIGMSKEILTRVFEPFFTTKSTGRGTGLGLSTIYGFIKQSNGNITVYSEPGVGTTVNLYLPRCDEAAPVHDGGFIPTAEPHANGERILVVEDNRDVRQLTVNRLKRLGYDTVECVSGAEARAALESGQEVSAVFTDIMMPGGMTGVELATWISANLPDLPVLLTTGFADEAVGKGGSDTLWPILRKPYTQKQLACMLRATIDEQAARQAPLRD
ncbi:PAS domain-containing sensor histidine kinase [Hyphomicrobium sp. 99]|uniref:hybrid sensor histidine kinase/response regulator n=1 Tax=Hyphomicrobium sp. 99 TaxID=1163419 RepID=UPI0005F7DE89|nr:PAS domain-containing hybrid sensor histidine kinase/response regulator [Hyphomicrobium sp. 99]